LAARTVEPDVERGLRDVLDSGEALSVDAVRALVVVEKPTIPTLAAFEVDLGEYNHLIQESSEQILAAGGGLHA
jgi:hypothetical protein